MKMKMVYFGAIGVALLLLAIPAWNLASGPAYEFPDSQRRDLRPSLPRQVKGRETSPTMPAHIERYLPREKLSPGNEEPVISTTEDPKPESPPAPESDVVKEITQSPNIPSGRPSLDPATINAATQYIRQHGGDSAAPGLVDRASEKYLGRELSSPEKQQVLEQLRGDAPPIERE
jgi:hypothetical protein